MYDVQFVDFAESDLWEIYSFLFTEVSEEFADKTISEIKQQCRTLRELPERGHRLRDVSQLGIERYLEINYKHFRIIYLISGNTVFVSHILDSRRDISTILTKRLTRL